MLHLVPRFLRQSSSAMMARLASRTSNVPPSDKPRVRLHPGNQQTIEEIAQGNRAQHKREIERLYEFEKLEIKDQTATHDVHRHSVKRELPSSRNSCSIMIYAQAENKVCLTWKKFWKFYVMNV